MQAAKFLIVVGGPTASGKTEWAIRLARHFDTEILSCDSRQFYRKLDIGTAKPSASELAQAPHHFIGHLDIDQDYSAGDFERDGLALLDQIFARRDVAVLSGGSGFFLQALCEGLDEFPEVPESIRRELSLRYEKEGLSWLQAELQRLDPEYFAQVDRQNPARLLRALSVCCSSGRPYSSFRRRVATPRSFFPIYLQLSWPRAVLYDRIDRRVDAMLDAGLVAEARSLYPWRERQALLTVGYAELFDYFDGKIDYEEAIRLIKRNSRRYAKRQLTWMRRDGHWKFIGPGDWQLALQYIGLAQSRNIRLQEVAAQEGFRSLTRLEFRIEDQLLAAIPIFHHASFDYIDSREILTEEKNLLVHEILLHQAVYACEDRPVYVWIEPPLELSRLAEGFLPTQQAPGALEAQLNAKASTAGSLWYRPGE